MNYEKVIGDIRSREVVENVRDKSVSHRSNVLKHDAEFLVNPLGEDDLRRANLYPVVLSLRFYGGWVLR